MANRRSGIGGTPRLAGPGSGSISCSNTRFVSIAWSEAYSRQRRSAITSNRTMATSTSSGLARFRACASTVMTARSGSSRRVAIVPMLASMGGLWTRAIRSIGRGKAGRIADVATYRQRCPNLRVAIRLSGGVRNEVALSAPHANFSIATMRIPLSRWVIRVISSAPATSGLHSTPEVSLRCGEPTFRARTGHEEVQQKAQLFDRTD